MRAPLLATLALLLAAGCVAPAPHDDADDALVRAESFDSAGRAWAAALTSGCGFCGPDDRDHWTLVVFEDARVALFRWTASAGDPSYDAAEMRALVAEARGGDAPHHEPTRVHTARLLDAETPRALRADWTRSTTTFGCTDFGQTLAVRDERGSVETHQATCLDADDPLQRFAARLWAIQADALERGARDP